MFNLFGAELYKWKKSKGFRVCLLAAAALVIIMWLSFMLADGIERGKIENGTMGVTVSGELPESEEGTSLFDEMGIMDMLQMFVGGGVSTLFIAVFVCIWVIGEYTGGAIKNTIGKGYSRCSIFFTKYLSTVVTSMVLNLLIIIIMTLVGAAVMGTERLNGQFWRDCCAYAGVELMLGMAFGGIIAAVSEFARNMAVGIGASIFIFSFSGLIANGFDLLFRTFHIDFRASDYWITCVIEACPAEGINMDIFGKAVYVTVLWILVSLFAGLVHFHEADI